MKNWIITIAALLVICLLLGFLSYTEFGSFNFARVGLALSNTMGTDKVIRIADAPERVWLVGTRGGLDAFRACLESDGWTLRMDEQMGALIPVEKDGQWDYVHWTVNGMYHKFTWQTAGDPARPEGSTPAEPVTLVYPGRLVGSAYFYPEQDQDFTALPALELSFRYPDTDTLLSPEHHRLYWEAETDIGFPVSGGFCVKAEDTAAFLEESLRTLGMTNREQEDLLIHLLPRLQDSGWNLIRFLEYHPLHISPGPDIGILVLCEHLDEPVEIEPQALTATDRTGFPAVQWACGVIN